MKTKEPTGVTGCWWWAALFILSLLGVVMKGAQAEKEFRLTAKDTLSVVELNRGETLKFRLADGSERTFEIVATSAKILFTNLTEPRRIQPDGGTVYEMMCTLKADGELMELRRYVCTQESFYEPYVINGVRLWFDAVKDVENFLTFGHGDCLPRRDVRLALQDATLRICPDEVLPWYDNSAGFIDVAENQHGDDCWMGPFGGLDAHGGLDVNQPAGAMSYAPIAFDDQFLFNSLANGDENNRWRGIRRWKNGEVWHLQIHHLMALFNPERIPLKAGVKLCTSAGVKYGTVTHSHFEFKVIPEGGKEAIPIDPWIVFWQSFEDRKKQAGEIRARMKPLRVAHVGAPLEFDASESCAGRGLGELQVNWSFGDGAWGFGAKTTHAFAKPGVYPVTVTVNDGARRAAFTQHVTVRGAATAQPAYGLFAGDEPTFRLRPMDAMDVYGIAPKFTPGTIVLRARAKRPMPDARVLDVVNIGGSELARASVSINYVTGKSWLEANVVRAGTRDQITLQANGTGLTVGLYRAQVKVRVANALVPDQVVEVELMIPSHPAMPPISRRVQLPREKIVDDTSSEFYATPWFWIGHKFAKIARGHRNFHLLNGGRAKAGEYVRFAPDLEASRYRVAFSADTPFASDAAFRVRVKHARGREDIWMHPSKSRTIGEFYFEDGIDGHVDILAEDSVGQVLADAVVFARIE